MLRADRELQLRGATSWTADAVLRRLRWPLVLAPLALVLVLPATGVRSAPGDAVLETIVGVAAVFAAVVAFTLLRAAPSQAALALVLALGLRAAATLLLVTGPALLGIPGTSRLLDHAMALSSVVGGVVFAWAAFAPVTPTRTDVSGAWLAAVALAAAIGVALAGVALGAIWPSIAPVMDTAGPSGISRLASHPVAFQVLEWTTVAGFLLAATGFARRIPEGAAHPFTWWLALGTALIAWAHLDYLLIARTARPWLSLGDLLRAAGILAIAIGALQEFRRSQRHAHEMAARAERARVARDLHDGVAQDLAYIAGQGPRLARAFPEVQALADVASAAEHALGDLRRTIFGLHRTSSTSLGPTVESRARELASRAGLRLTLTVADEIDVSPQVTHVFLSVLNEAMSNAARHSGATEVRVSLTKRGHTIALRVFDNGRGLDAAIQSPSEAGGFGVMGMRERAREIGAELSLSSDPGGGTTLELAI